MRKWLLWAALMAVGCNGKLTVGAGDGGAAGASVRGGAETPDEDPPPLVQGNTAWPPMEGIAGAAYIAGVGGTGPGEIGQNCIPGGLVSEAVGSPAKAQIRTLDRCYEGLACTAEGKCVPAPDCPDSGLCVLRRAALSGSGGSGGAPGANMPSAGTPGFATGGGPEALPAVYEESGVVALTASDSHVYWLEYGTRDALGNHQHDGALMSYSIGDGATTTVATGLAGPMGLELTESHAYVYIDGAPLIGAWIQPQLLRVPLAGGDAELVQAGTQPQHAGFTAAGGKAFWTAGATVYSMLSDSNAVPTAFLTVDAKNLNSDATDLYYATPGNDLMRAPLTGAEPSAVGLSVENFALHDDGIFALESIDTSYTGGLLSRAPKSGGAFQRVRALGAGRPNHLKVVVDRYFLDVIPKPVQIGNGQPFAYKMHVMMAGFVGTAPPIRLLERAVRGSVVDRLWVGTAGALYWSEGQAIYRQPLPTP